MASKEQEVLLKYVETRKFWIKNNCNKKSSKESEINLALGAINFAQQAEIITPEIAHNMRTSLPLI